jgi:hypothetical protein
MTTMTQIILTLDDEQLNRLRKSAERAELSVEEAARHGLMTYLDREAEFQRITEYLLTKNAELYRRLAQ